jgi:hypothetical protein
MAWTVEWAKRALAGEDPRTLCDTQIAAFTSPGAVE